VNSIGADEHVAARGRAVGSVAIEEIGGHAGLVLGKGAEPMAGVDARLAETRAHGVVDHPLQPPSVDRELRIFVAGIGAARLAPDLLPETIGIDELEGADGDRVEPLQQAELGQLLDRMRQRIDADPKLADGLRLLVDFAVDPARVQHQGGGQPADAAPDDDAFHDGAHSVRDEHA